MNITPSLPDAPRCRHRHPQQLGVVKTQSNPLHWSSPALTPSSSLVSRHPARLPVGSRARNSSAGAVMKLLIVPQTITTAHFCGARPSRTAVRHSHADAQRSISCTFENITDDNRLSSRKRRRTLCCPHKDTTLPYRNHPLFVIGVMIVAQRIAASGGRATNAFTEMSPGNSSFTLGLWCQVSKGSLPTPFTPVNSSIME